MQIEPPYLLFLGDAADQLAAKTADGVARWRPDWCRGQLRLPGCRADVGLPDMTLAEGRRAGARTLILGVANRGGVISDEWMTTLLEALDAGYDIASGLHNRLSLLPRLTKRAEANNCRLFDVRYPEIDLAVAGGQPRSGRRLLTVGTDCSCGKMFSALAIEREMRERGMPADFRATGQTGILIAGSGISVDAVVADFISGAVEWLAPAASTDHWDIIEGQGSLFHASYAGVCLGLLHGAQADALVMCHEPTRRHMRGLPDAALPSLSECITLNEQCGRLTNPKCRVIGLSVNTAALDETASERLLGEIEAQTGLPAVDAYRHGAGRLVDALA
ncbi:MAG: DUF1611 domain-containing protein [Candidatus Latescibacteria bacterium]|jgi:uncharacterized NAD-dependent epimerase/dehydratase family protein|nr:EBNA-1 nuclear protein [Gemmatimonadaceae bacterium]MDP6015826.1 DUF1611 domain-containing protein [Candidatus Latescibacterota bacterium]MDP7450082.1 DUF1611 domain-containing protein [Candidatus Latescibacterota bacterium]HJP29140.1 N-acetyltransferase DgcN [Candidatus Latescibacterota bacterium]